jgi:hypothetical protein
VVQQVARKWYRQIYCRSTASGLHPCNPYKRPGPGVWVRPRNNMPLFSGGSLGWGGALVPYGNLSGNFQRRSPIHKAQQQHGRALTESLKWSSARQVLVYSQRGYRNVRQNQNATHAATQRRREPAALKRRRSETTQRQATLAE